MFKNKNGYITRSNTINVTFLTEDYQDKENETH